MFVAFTREFNVLEDFVNRASPPWQLVKAPAETALREAGWEFERLRWSQRAGCSCPCSPGFIMMGVSKTPEGVRRRGHGLALWLDLSEDVPTPVDVNVIARAQVAASL